ncbi:MAG TPA: LysM peptidoglycan-binding domain-containing protein [Geobacteraceae bacterium]|nr:LysM peptidoglycan-binding domain-containing protein [Geobacteraceae bacterium]
MIIERVRSHGADKILPYEFKSVEETLVMGDALLLEDESEEADNYFHLAWTKGKILEMNLAAEKLRRAEAARLKAQAEKRERQRERQRVFQEEQRRLLQESTDAPESVAHEKKIERPSLSKEKPLPFHHTVMRGETLPQIASQSDVYNDQTLWPLLYRANRDQIRDPGHIWPGQVLRIPRNLSREEIAEARRYSQEKPLR